MPSHERANDSVSRKVTANVSSIPAAFSASSDRASLQAKVIHLSSDLSGWSFQRRIPKSIVTTHSKAVLKARLWPMTIAEARLVSRHLGYWTDCVFGMLTGAKLMFDEIDLSNPDATLSGMTTGEIVRLHGAMMEAFDSEVDRLRQSKTLHPRDNSIGMISAVRTLQQEIDDLRAAPDTVQRHCDIEMAVGRVEAELTGIVSRNEKTKGFTEINVMSSRTKSIHELKECFRRAPTSHAVMMAALSALSDIYDDRQSDPADPSSETGTTTAVDDPAAIAINQPIDVQLVDSLPGSDGAPGAASSGAVQPTLPAAPTRGAVAGEEPVSETDPMSARQPSTELDTPSCEEQSPYPASDQSSAGSEAANDKTTAATTELVAETSVVYPQFAGLTDRAHVYRPEAAESNYPLLSIAAGEYLQGWARRLGATVPVAFNKLEWDVKVKEPTGVASARNKIQVFIDIIGDHKIDTYKKRDFQTFVDLIIFYPKNSKQTKACRGVPTRSLILGIRGAGYANVDPAHLATLSKVSIKNGYLAFINSTIRAWTDEAETMDQLIGINLNKLRYPKKTIRDTNKDQVSRRTLTAVFNKGLESGRLADAMLPLFGLLATRRLGLLTHLMGTDITSQFGDAENPIHTVKCRSVVTLNGKKVIRPLKTSDAEKTFTLHALLSKIGFTDWMLERNDKYVFEALHLYEDPSRSVSKRMSRLFESSGALAGESFKSLRDLSIDMYDDNVKKSGRAVRQMSGHAAKDVHDKSYGVTGLTEDRAIELTNINLPEWLEVISE